MDMSKPIITEGHLLGYICFVTVVVSLCITRITTGKWKDPTKQLNYTIKTFIVSVSDLESDAEIRIHNNQSLSIFCLLCIPLQSSST